MLMCPDIFWAQNSKSSWGASRSGRPLEAQVIAVWIGDIQLLHAIRSNDWLLYSKALGTKMIVRAFDMRASKVPASVVVCSCTVCIGNGWALVGFIGGIEHQFDADHPQQRPIELFARSRGAYNFEAKNVPVKM